MMKNKRKEWKRIAAFILAALLAVNSIDLSVFTAYAKEAIEQTANADEKETTDNKAVVTITGFADLEESVTNQQLAIGAGEDEIVFPDTLDVTVAVSASEETSDTEMEETEESEASETESEEAETEESETSQAETEETEKSETTGITEETESDTDSSETETVTGEGEVKENTESRNRNRQCNWRTD